MSFQCLENAGIAKLHLPDLLLIAVVNFARILVQLRVSLATRASLVTFTTSTVRTPYLIGHFEQLTRC